MLVNQDLVHCTCCSDYLSWKIEHSNEAKSLQAIANQPYYYQVCDVEFNVDGHVSLIITLSMPYLGQPKANVKKWQAELEHTLMFVIVVRPCCMVKVARKANNLKHPRGVYRAGKSGVQIKYNWKRE